MLGCCSGTSKSQLYKTNLRIREFLARTPQNESESRGQSRGEKGARVLHNNAILQKQWQCCRTKGDACCHLTSRWRRDRLSVAGLRTFALRQGSQYPNGYMTYWPFVLSLRQMNRRTPRP
jgi:hypothetical protein